MSVSNETNPPLGKTLAAMLPSLLHDLFGHYRPERHYMRGPGPKWREKQARLAAPPAPSRPHRDFAQAAIQAAR